MAAANNQGLQITVIVFVILTLILAVATFLFYSSYRDASERADAQTEEAQRQGNANRQAQQELEALKNMIGVEPTASADVVKSRYEEDKTAYMATFPEDKQRYRDALEFLVTSLNEANVARTELDSQLTELKDKLLALEAESKQQIDEFEAMANQAQADKEAELAKFNADRDKLNQEQQTLAEQLAARSEALDTAKTEFDTKQKETDVQLTRSEGQVRELREQIKEITKTTFEVSDGEVIRVDHAKGRVWINIGSDQALPRQTTFSVYTSDENDVARFESKGRIEVTKVMGPQIAEARILENKLTAPIIKGDKIFTPLWHAGRQERFALAGWFDLDDDTKSDRQMIRDLITRVGGAIDAEVDDHGIPSGELTVNTRYLVVGEEPEGEGLKAFNDVIRDARNKGIEVLNVSKFLDQIGYYDEGRVLNFTRSQPREFREPRPDGGYPSFRGNVSELFRKRQPAHVLQDSAYETDTEKNAEKKK